MHARGGGVGRSGAGNGSYFEGVFSEERGDDEFAYLAAGLWGYE